MEDKILTPTEWSRQMKKVHRVPGSMARRITKKLGVGYKYQCGRGITLLTYDQWLEVVYYYYNRGRKKRK